MSLKFFIKLIFSFLLVIALSINTANAQNQDISVDIGYPAVDQMEAQIWGASYPQQDIYERLNRLEMRVFGSVTNDPLINRVDRLRNSILNEPVQQNNNVTTMGNMNMTIDGMNIGNMNSGMNYNNNRTDEYSIIVYELEKKLLGSTYITDPLESRVARLENRVFASSSDNYPMGERVQRLCAYADAQNTNDYYNDQAQLGQYNNVVTGARVISVLFMILQALL